MNQEKTIILGIELDTSSLLQSSKESRLEIDRLKAKQKELVKSGNENSVEFEENAAHLRRLNSEYRDIKKTIDNVINVRESETGSIEQMRAELSIATKEYNQMSAATRDSSKEGQDLQIKIKGLSDALKGNESAVGDNRRNVGNYGDSLKDLKVRLREAKDELAGLDAGSDEYQAAAARAGELADKIAEIGENVKAQAGGSGFEKLSNTVGNLTDKLQNLDFKGVSEDAKQFSEIAKGMSFKEMIGGLKEAVTGLGTMAKAILANPVFLLAAAIVTTIIAIKQYADAVKQEAIEATNRWSDALKRRLELTDMTIDRVNKLNEDQVRLAEAQGKSEEELLKMRRNNLESDYRLRQTKNQEFRTQIKDLQAAFDKEEDEETKKKLHDQIEELKDQKDQNLNLLADHNTNVKILEAEGSKKVSEEKKKLNDELKKINDDRLKSEHDSLVKRLENEKAGAELLLVGVEEYSVKYIGLKTNLLLKERNLELSNKDLTANEKKLIDARYTQSVKDLTKDSLKLNEEKAKEELDKALKLATDKGEINRIGLAKKILDEKQAIDEKFNQGLIDEENYLLQSEALEFDSLNRIKQAKIDALNQESILLKEGSVERALLEEEAAQLGYEISKSGEDKKRSEIKKTSETQKAAGAASLSIAQNVFGGLTSLLKEGSAEYKAFARLQIAAQTAQGVMTAFSQAQVLGPIAGPIAGSVLAGIVIAQGVKQLGEVNKLEKGGIIPKAARGIILGGEPHSRGGTKFVGSDGTRFEAEKDELLAVVNKRSTGMLRGLSNLNVKGGGIDFFQKGGVKHLADGGFADRSISQSVFNDVMNQNRMKDIIVSMPSPVVIVQDINESQDNLAKVIDGATI